MMQILVIGVGEFGLNVACSFMTHLVLEHDLLSCQTEGDDTKSLFFSRSNTLRANLLLFDTDYDPYMTVLGKYPLLVPFVNRSQVVWLDLPGGSHFKVIQAINAKKPTTKDYIRDLLRKEMEARQYQSIMVFHSIAGGTGSGLTACILSVISLLKMKLCQIVNIMLVPSDGMHSTNNLEWYNAAAGLESVSDTCDLTIMLDNQALYKVYKNSILGVEEMNVSLDDLNRLIVQMVASLTGSQRHPSELPKKFQDIIVNTVLYRCIHFVVPSLYDPKSITQYTPTTQQQNQQQFHQVSSEKSYHSLMTPEILKKYGRYRFTQPKTFHLKSPTKLQNYTSPVSMLVDLFDQRYQLATCDDYHATNVKQFYQPKDKFVSAFTSFNALHEGTLINQAFVHAKDYLMKASQTDFMSMSPCPFSFSLTHQPVYNWRLEGDIIHQQEIEMGACMLQNKFTIHNIFDRIHRNVSQVYAKKAFFQWVDPQEVQKQIDGVKCLERDYGDWIQAEEIVHLFEESLREDEPQSQSNSLSDSF